MRARNTGWQIHPKASLAPGLGSVAFIEHVGEPAMQPGFAGDVVVAAVNGFVEHVGKIAAQPDYFLLKPGANGCHQILIAAVPQLVAMRERISDAMARPPRRRVRLSILRGTVAILGASK